jgi:pimeloyl-ACP methyl ester carboxylesterase
MLNECDVAARIPVRDLERARRFYHEKLGLEPAEERPGGLLYRCGGGAFALFESSGTASGEHTQMGWEVSDLPSTVAALRSRGLVFEEYDLPGLRTIDGIAEVEGNYPSKGGKGELGAWFKDSEGNLLGLGQPLGRTTRSDGSTGVATRSLPPVEAEATVRLSSGYASVDGLEMYYEVHGSGRPLVLLHGGLATIDDSFGRILPSLARARRVVAVEQQGHGHTADLDRPLSYERMADDTASLLRHMRIGEADLFGYSDGANVALQIAVRHPALVRKLVIAAGHYHPDGYHPVVHDALAQLSPDALAGSSLEGSYRSVAPIPERWPTLIDKVTDLDARFAGWPSESIRSIRAPALIIVGDADFVRPEHAVELFRLFGGGVAGDFAGLPRSRLAILPGVTHLSLLERTDWLLPMITEFLDAP